MPTLSELFTEESTPAERLDIYRKENASLRKELETSQAECLEQARLNGMGASRELALMTRVEALEAERDQLIDNEKSYALAVNAATAWMKRAKSSEVALRRALFNHLRTSAAQYLLSNLRARSNGAMKAQYHAEMTTAYVSTYRNVDPDLVRRYFEVDYKAVHDSTAELLTDRLDETCGFDLDGRVDDALIEDFFAAFDRIARRALAKDTAREGGND